MKRLELTKHESNTLKGLYIVLIILGHNHLLCPTGGLGMVYLYKFHVIAFFILPFFYTNYQGKLSIKNIGAYAVRNYVPYVLFFIFSFLVFHIVILKDGLDFRAFLTGLFSGNSPTLKQTSGFYFLWFLPAFFAVTLVRMVYDNVNKYWSILILVFSVSLHLLLSYSQKEALFRIVPFAVLQGFYYFAYGVIAFYIYSYIPAIKYIGAIVFLIISFAFFMGYPFYIPFLFPVSFVLFSLTIVKYLVHVPYLDKLGNYSLPIYLIHVYINNVFERLFPHTFIYGCLSLLLTVLIAYFISVLLIKSTYLQKLIFPRNWNELKTFYRK